MGSTGRRLFIGGTPGIELRHRELEEIFGKIGPLCDVLVLQGFAFIEFVNLPDAERAVSELHSFQACGGRLSVQYARPPRPKDPSRFAPPYGPPADYGGAGGGRDRGPPGPGFQDRDSGNRSRRDSGYSDRCSFASTRAPDSWGGNGRDPGLPPPSRRESGNEGFNGGSRFGGGRDDWGLGTPSKAPLLNDHRESNGWGGSERETLHTGFPGGPSQGNGSGGGGGARGVASHYPTPQTDQWNSSSASVSPSAPSKHNATSNGDCSGVLVCKDPTPCSFRLKVSGIPTTSSASGQKFKKWAALAENVERAELDGWDPSNGFIEFKNDAGLEKALRALESTELFHEKVRVEAGNTSHSEVSTAHSDRGSESGWDISRGGPAGREQREVTSQSRGRFRDESEEYESSRGRARSRSRSPHR